MQTAVKVTQQEQPLRARVQRTAYVTAKRVLDVAASAVLLLLTLPLWILVVVAIRLDSSGRALFRQERVGLHGERFRILKFRTMHAGADDTFHRQHHEDLANGDRASQPIRLEDDPRITRVGRFVRRWSLDELPNLWNVLVGDMTLVGPRPLVPYEVELLDREARRRLLVKPGITGLAQVNGRLDLSVEGRANLDQEYVAAQSLWLDTKILLKTVPALLRNRGA